MGIFGSRKKTYVSSVVYNLAGDENKRPNYLRTTIFGGVMQQVDSLGQTITDSYINGPGMRFRNFARWSRTSGYTDTVGLVTGNLRVTGNIDSSVIAGQIPHGSDEEVNMQSASIGAADYTFWADRWMTENHPDLISSNWRSDMDGQTIRIYLDEVLTYSFVASDFDPEGRYLYASYSLGLPPKQGPVETGDVVPLAPGDSWPSIIGWTAVDQNHYTRTQYKGNDPVENATYSLKEDMYFLTETNGDRSYRIDSQKIYSSRSGNLQVLIYKQGSGNAVLDALFVPATNDQSFFPFIPFRLDNKFVSEDYLPDVYKAAKKAMTKATNGKFDDMIEKIKENDSIDDIDYAYAVFGVSLNVKENACKEYVYRFFKTILEEAATDGSGAYNEWRTKWNAADAAMKQWNEWKTAQGNPSDPLYGTPEPAQVSYPAMPLQELRVTSGNNPTMNYDMTIEWNSIQEEVRSGLGKPGAKRGELWFEVRQDELYEQFGQVNGRWESLFSKVVNNIDLYWQDSANSYRVLHIKGLNHTNLIYNNKSVEILGKEALEDTEESGFIIPLHEGIYRAMSLKQATQMSTACSFVVFNCYQVVKKKWYQTGLFQVVLIVVAIVVTVVFPPGGAAAGGILGSNVAVGTAIGLSGTLAIVVGAVANAIAAMLLVTIIQRGAVAIFGDKLGTIIGAIASVVALQVGTGMAQGQTMSSAFANMGRADNLLQLTNAGIDGYSKYVNISTQGVLQEIQQTLDSYKVESERISDAYAKEFGLGGRTIIDPLMLTEASNRSFIPETRQDFLNRTLLLGSEICDVSLEMISRFADLTLSTKLPT